LSLWLKFRDQQKARKHRTFDRHSQKPGWLVDDQGIVFVKNGNFAGETRRAMKVVPTFAG
jgi:hypothetical protein